MNRNYGRKYTQANFFNFICFVFSVATMQYQIDMMRKLREVNVDHFHVGWYQSTFLGSFLNRNFIESQFHHQKSIEESIVIVYGKIILLIILLIIIHLVVKFDLINYLSNNLLIHSFIHSASLNGNTFRPIADEPRNAGN